MIRTEHDESIAIRGRVHGRLGSGVATAARPILNDELPAQPLRQPHPTRPVRIIVPFAPAGGSDITARLLGTWLSGRLGQQFVIENRPGAASNIGTEAVARAPGDGYTLLLASASAAINVTLYDKLNFNFLRDITPVASIARNPLVH